MDNMDTKNQAAQDLNTQQDQPDTQAWENKTILVNSTDIQSARPLVRSLSLQNFLNENSTQFIRCPNPGCEFFFECIGAGDSKLISREDDEDPSPDAILHYQRHRFRCRSCSEEFCIECKKIPYHEGYTCNEYKVASNAVHCRFCDKLMLSKDASQIQQQLTALVKQPNTVVDNVCDACLWKVNDCHSGAFPCGHQKYCTSAHLGTCPPCIHPDCVSNGANLEDYCQMCGIDRLKNSPVIRLKCGHTFHYYCVKQRLQNRWTACEVNLNFSKCQICFQPISAFFKLWEDMQLLEDLTTLRKHLYLLIQTYSKSENISLLVNDERSFVDEGLRVMNFYECFKCKCIYFGGVRECGTSSSSKREESLCNNCKSRCELHGSEHMVYKCRFCCAFASYFCFGHTHFCENCHKKAWDILQGPKQEFLKIQVTQCLGKSSCPLQIEHSPNGEEFAMFCSMCEKDSVGSPVVRVDSPPLKIEPIETLIEAKIVQNSCNTNNNNNNNNNNVNNNAKKKKQQQQSSQKTADFVIQVAGTDETPSINSNVIRKRVQTRKQKPVKRPS